ncbi:hypothetical protein [uncultured Desulfosarcina sp.]|uniref:hypothetical protein n=1 Tax=uncultured Desulfosarcina sp. TaxID=218289 RepID=UPI0029C6EAA7|nr:hypothetical protein [uncultured Desulfosarcina sp.]
MDLGHPASESFSAMQQKGTPGVRMRLPQVCHLPVFDPKVKLIIAPGQPAICRKSAKQGESPGKSIFYVEFSRQFL